MSIVVLNPGATCVNNNNHTNSSNVRLNNVNRQRMAQSFGVAHAFGMGRASRLRRLYAPTYTCGASTTTTTTAGSPAGSDREVGTTTSTLPARTVAQAAVARVLAATSQLGGSKFKSPQNGGCGATGAQCGSAWAKGGLLDDDVGTLQPSWKVPPVFLCPEAPMDPNMLLQLHGAPVPYDEVEAALAAASRVAAVPASIPAPPPFPGTRVVLDGSDVGSSVEQCTGGGGGALQRQIRGSDNAGSGGGMVLQSPLRSPSPGPDWTIDELEERKRVARAQALEGVTRFFRCDKPDCTHNLMGLQPPKLVRQTAISYKEIVQVPCPVCGQEKDVVLYY